jgi:hypothetical protein
VVRHTTSVFYVDTVSSVSRPQVTILLSCDLHNKQLQNRLHVYDVCAFSSFCLRYYLLLRYFPHDDTDST